MRCSGQVILGVLAFGVVVGASATKSARAACAFQGEFVELQLVAQPESESWPDEGEFGKYGPYDLRSLMLGDDALYFVADNPDFEVQ